MLFNSWAFAAFFPIVTLVYFLLPPRWRWAWLLLASCYFYACYVPAYLGVLAVIIVVDFTAGLMIAGSQGRARRLWLLASMAANLGMLGFYKYFNFLNANVAALAKLIHWNYPIQALHFLLPLGLSFHVFQSLAYTIEVYRGNQAPERHPGIFALYVMFYPQLVAGPIERPQRLLHQLHEVHGIDVARIGDGLQRMLWGLFKKVVVADRLALGVDQVFSHPQDFHGLPVVLAAVFFTFEIYCDFSGYSDIALGAAQVMGFKLTENFRRPFAAKSIQEFWTRWHMSLSSWFNDYVFTPLAFRYKDYGKPAIVGATLFTFALSGLWHGAGWKFIIFGLIHGVGVAFDVLAKKARNRLAKRLPPWLFNGASVLGTFAIVAFAFIFFRANSTWDALALIRNSWQDLGQQLVSPSAAWAAVRELKRPNVAYGVAGIIVLELVHALRPPGAAPLPRAVRWAACYAMIVALALFGVFDNRAFIYFQF
jgi:D-alanyl-lipoteichoic acid acyltransferase DltB (MBOAT superfamily)